MTVFTPYSGSLLRLALTTVAVAALFAAGFSCWQYYAAHPGAAAAPHTVLR